MIDQQLRLFVEWKLISQEDVDFFMCYYERQGRNPIKIILENGVEEGRVFQLAADYFHLPLYGRDFDRIPPAVAGLVPGETPNRFNTLWVGEQDRLLQVVFWNFFEASIIPRALKNLTGKQVSLYLVPCSVYDRLIVDRDT